MMSDLFEAQGWSIWFIGAGVPDDELLQLLGKLAPDVLTVHGANPEDVPPMRGLIHYIRQMGICEDMQILVCGGVFARADGLDEEIRADLFAADIKDAVRTLEQHPMRIPKPDVPEPGRRRKRKRKVAPTLSGKPRRATAETKA
jgi:methanogenic corrinoid protein MtbC1